MADNSFVQTKHEIKPKNLNKNKGFTLVEALVSMAILGIVLVSMGSLVTNLYKSQNQVSTKNEASEFVSSVSKYLLSKQGCDQGLVGVAIPTAIDAAFTLVGYSGYGATTGSIASGFKVSPRLTVSSLQIKDKGVAPYIIVKNGLNYQRTIAQIKFKFSVSNGSSSVELQERYVEVPILQKLAPASGTIDACLAELTIEDACVAAGGIFTAPSTCTMASACEFKGTAFGCWPYNTCPSASYPTATQYTIATAADITSPPASICPLGGTPTSTGFLNYTYSAPPCGKACTTYSNVAYFYMCLKCN